MDDEKLGFLRSLGPLASIATVFGAFSALFVGLWWAATWFANVSELSADQAKLADTVQALQTAEVAESVTIATLQQEVADNQAEIRQNGLDDENRHDNR
jgi:hypothetical protein